eukprot:52813-Eustigmatos_ZCMA.PRE.1
MVKGDHVGVNMLDGSPEVALGKPWKDRFQLLQYGLARILVRLTVQVHLGMSFTLRVQRLQTVVAEAFLHTPECVRGPNVVKVC